MKQVKQLTDALQAEQVHKSELTQDIETLREQLEEAEDTVYDQKNAITSVRRVGAQQRLYVILTMLKANREKKMMVDEATKEAMEILEKTKKSFNSKIQGYQTTVKGLEQEVRLHEETRNAMHDTLVNHKRAMLMEHKVQSSVLQQDLAALVEQKDEIEAQRMAVLKESSRLEGAVKEIEHQMHELSKVSAIQDGRINIAHAKKKRRLDQEFERMLSRTQDKRDHLQRIESKLQELDDKRQEKEDQMKELERNLVALLVEQQKRLLSIIRTDPKIGKKTSGGGQKS
jgi:chromosome segregation ATPase